MAPEQLPSYLRSLLERVICKTGYRVAIEEVELLEFDSEVRYASADAPIHHIRVSRDFRDHRSHFVLSSLAKIDRYFSTPTADRRLPVVDMAGRLAHDEETVLRRRLPGAPEALIAEVSNRLFVGLARQLLSFPLDLRVERELYDCYQAHHPLQLAYLARQVRDFEPHFSPQVESVSPPKAYAASSAMNCAFAEICAGLTGERLPRVVRYSRHRLRGEELLHALDACSTVGGHAGDRLAQDSWAQTLGLRDLYAWSSG
jgi:hypothetical protein